MKEIKSYIKHRKLNDVTLALHQVEGLTGMSVVDVKGFGRSRGKDAPRRIVEDLVDYVPHVKIEIVCSNSLVDEIISVIRDKAHTGLRGDGKIYVTDVETAIRIQSGEQDESEV